MISHHVYDLCHSESTVSSEAAKDPSKPPGDIFCSLFPDKTSVRSVSSQVENEIKPSTGPHQEAKGKPAVSPAEIQKAFECGKWGKTRPSDLFLKVSAMRIINIDGD